MNTNKKERSFDCVKMKNDIQAKIYAETKHMDTTELLEYFNSCGVSQLRQGSASSQCRDTINRVSTLSPSTERH
jgi:anti-anti-sigma regulatory factor